MRLTTMRFLVAGCAAAILLTGTSAMAAPILVHQYQLNGTLADDFAGPSLTAHGGTLNATNYAFDANEGLTLANGINAYDYSIVLDFEFSDVGGYNKVLDFEAQGSDEGLYVYNSEMYYYPFAAGPPIIPPNTMIRMALTRDGASDAVSGYVNGVLQFTFTDSGDGAAFDAVDNLITFFMDDFATSLGEASGGIVDTIRIWDGALSASEVADLGSLSEPAPVPEPSSLLLLGGGMIVAAARLRRRK